MNRRTFIGSVTALLAVPGCAVWEKVKPFLPVPTVTWKVKKTYRTWPPDGPVIAEFNGFRAKDLGWCDRRDKPRWEHEHRGSGEFRWIGLDLPTGETGQYRDYRLASVFIPSDTWNKWAEVSATRRHEALLALCFNLSIVSREHWTEVIERWLVNWTTKTGE